MNRLWQDYHKRKTNSELRNAIEVRYKTNGKIHNRQFDPGTTRERAIATVAGNGGNHRKILGTGKIRPEDVIGTIKSMNLQDIIGAKPRRMENVVFDSTTLDSIVFPKLGQNKKAKTLARKQKSNREKERQGLAY